MRARVIEDAASPVPLRGRGWIAGRGRELVAAVLVGGRPVFLVVYATLAPVAIIASAWRSSAQSRPMVMATKTILLGVGFCWVWARRRMTTVEWIIVLGVIPSATGAYSAWVAGPPRDDIFVAAMMGVAALIAVAATARVIIVCGILEVAAFTAVQLHFASIGYAIASSFLMAALVAVVIGLVASTAHVLRATLADSQALIEQMPAATFRFDANSREILYASPQTAQLTGEPAEAWLGAEGYARWLAALVDFDPAPHEDLTREREPGTTWQAHFRFRHADGSLRWFRAVSLMVSPGVGQSVVFDATAQITAERELEVERQRYKTLVEQIPAVTFRRAADGTLVYVSPQIEELIGYPADEFLSRVNEQGWDDLVHPDDLARVMGDYPFPPDHPERTEIEYRVRARDGGYRDILVRRVRIDTPGGERVLHTVAVDLTDLRAAERRSREALTALVRAGEDVLARLAVELHDDTLRAMAAMQIELDRLATYEPGITGQLSMRSWRASCATRWSEPDG